MLMVCPDEGKLRLLEWMLTGDGTGLPDFHIALFQNDYTPVAASTFSDFTPSSFTGATPIAIARSDFDLPFILSHVGYAVLPDAPTWTCTAGGPQDAHGWYLYTDDDETVLFAQRFDAVRVMDAAAEESIDPFRIAMKTYA